MQWLGTTCATATVDAVDKISLKHCPKCDWQGNVPVEQIRCPQCGGHSGIVRDEDRLVPIIAPAPLKKKPLVRCQWPGCKEPKWALCVDCGLNLCKKHYGVNDPRRSVSTCWVCREPIMRGRLYLGAVIEEQCKKILSYFKRKAISQGKPTNEAGRKR